MMRFIDEDEILVYQVPKRRGPILFMIIFHPIWLYFASIFLIPSFKAVFSGTTTKLDSEYYIAGLVGLVIFLPIAIIIPLSYFLNQFILTNRRVYMRKGIGGKLIIINTSDICSFQHAYSTGRNNTNHSIIFYLKCGKHVRSGELYMTLNGLQTLLTLLRERFEGRGYTGQELKQIKLDNPEACPPLIKRNLFVILLTLAPFILALILAGLWLI